MFRVRGGMLLALCLFVTVPVFAQAPSELDQLKDQADTAYRERNFAKAIELCDKVLASAPTDHVALYLRGSSRVELGIFSGNVEQVRAGIADAREAIRHEANAKPEYYLPYLYGMSHLTTLENKPVHAKTALAVADSILDRDDLDAEQRANLYYQRAQASLHLKDFPTADADLQAALKENPKHLAALMLIAQVAARSKSQDEAVQAYTNVVNAFPSNPLVYNNRGMYLQSIGRTSDALADFTKATQLDPKFLPAYINRGYALLESNDPAGAEAALTQCLSYDPNQIGAISLRATARLDQHKMADAIADYRKVAQLADKNPMAHADLAFALFFNKDYMGALAEFKKALSLDAKLRFLLPWKLACEMQLNQVNPADYAQVTSKAETDRDWVDQLVLFQLGQTDASSMLKSVSSTDENARKAQLCEGYYFIGLELLRRGRNDDAMAYFNQAVKEKLPKLSAYRGSMYALKAGGGTTR